MSPERRELLRFGALASAACACGVVGIGCGDDATPPEGLATDITLQLADYPELATDGGIASVSSSVTGYDYAILVRNDAGVFAAFSAWCSHEGCSVSPSGEGFRCPCHGARFNSAGGVTSGPAPRGLITFDTESTDSTLTILAGG